MSDSEQITQDHSRRRDNGERIREAILNEGAVIVIARNGEAIRASLIHKDRRDYGTGGTVREALYDLYENLS